MTILLLTPLLYQDKLITTQMNWDYDSTESRLLSSVCERANFYLQRIQKRRVAPLPQDFGIPEELTNGPVDLGKIVSELDEFGWAGTVANAGPRYFGFVNGGALPASLLASWFVSAWDQNAALYAMSPIASELERIALKWVLELLNLPADAGGALVTGATMANFTCLAAARHALLGRLGWDVEADGLFHAPEIKVIVGEEAHPSFLKALGLLGLGRARVGRVPADAQGRMRPELLPSLDSRTILCIQAGNVNSGAIDPADEICRAAKKAGAWVHVDGAFGLWAAASPAYRHFTKGYELADSWATDGHKMPNLGYDCGIAVVRDAASLRSAMSISAAYFPVAEHRDPMDFTPECSRRARGVELWAALRSLGRDGMAELVERCCARAKQFAEGLAGDGYEILNDVVLNQVLVSFGRPDVTEAVIRDIQIDGTCWCGGTQWHGKKAMRISVSSWATTAEDVDLSLAAIRRIAKARLNPT
jgi:glutamate/tyrosine decarboxylase-like PLP-dependent enzyme